MRAKVTVVVLEPNPDRPSYPDSRTVYEQTIDLPDGENAPVTKPVDVLVKNIAKVVNGD